jgi:hypothetical protein
MGNQISVIFITTLKVLQLHIMCARIRGTVYVYELDSHVSMYKLDLATLNWTKIETNSCPGFRHGCSFTAMDCHRIAVYGGLQQFPVL